MHLYCKWQIKICYIAYHYNLSNETFFIVSLNLKIRIKWSRGVFCTFATLTDHWLWSKRKGKKVHVSLSNATKCFVSRYTIPGRNIQPFSFQFPPAFDGQLMIFCQPCFVKHLQSCPLSPMLSFCLSSCLAWTICPAKITENTVLCHYLGNVLASKSYSCSLYKQLD